LTIFEQCRGWPRSAGRSEYPREQQYQKLQAAASLCFV
jgi:hypothetical protein